jgi:hypothetical protein
MGWTIRLRQFPIQVGATVAYHATYVLYNDQGVAVETINGGASNYGQMVLGVAPFLAWNDYALGAWVTQGQGPLWRSEAQGATERTVYPPDGGAELTEAQARERWDVGVSAVQRINQQSWNQQFDDIFGNGGDNFGWHYAYAPTYPMQGNSNSVALAVGAAMFGDIYSRSQFETWLPGTGIQVNLGANIRLLSVDDINSIRPQIMQPLPNNWYERQSGSIETIGEGNIRKAVYTTIAQD